MIDFILKLILNALAVIITAYLLPGVHLTDFWYAVILAALLALLNVSVKPVLIFLTIPATIISLGLFLLVINAFIIIIASWILEPNFKVDGFWWALLFSILLSVIGSLFERLTIKAKHREDSVKVFDKDGNRIA
ncbi:MAG: phage holin family protein [Bacteroidetes bacterium]|nr:phage holin family protein [Bacteroidota bacterium]